MRWALRSLTHGNGLSAAVVVACGVPLAELESRSKAAPTDPTVAAAGTAAAAAVTPRVAALPPPPPPLVAPAADAAADEEPPLPPFLEGARAGVGLTMFAKTGRAF